MTTGKKDNAKVAKASDKRNKAERWRGGRHEAMKEGKGREGRRLGSQAERQMRNSISDGAHVKPAPFHHRV